MGRGRDRVHAVEKRTIAEESTVRLGENSFCANYERSKTTLK